jgi:hypothetical protein
MGIKQLRCVALHSHHVILRLRMSEAIPLPASRIHVSWCIYLTANSLITAVLKLRSILRNFCILLESKITAGYT